MMTRIALRDLDSTFDRLAGARRALGLPSFAASRPWVPAVDIAETPDRFLLALDVPGVAPGSVDLRFEQHTLTVRGVRTGWPVPQNDQELRWYMAERAQGEFARSIQLPEYVDSERIEASLHDGVLTIVVPKLSAARPRRIEVSAARPDRAGAPSPDGQRVETPAQPAQPAQAAMGSGNGQS